MTYPAGTWVIFDPKSNVADVYKNWAKGLGIDLSKSYEVLPDIRGWLADDECAIHLPIDGNPNFKPVVGMASFKPCVPKEIKMEDFL